MNNTDLQNIIDKAAFLVGGYAFWQRENNIEIVALKSPNHVLIMSQDGDIIESSMDDIEIAIVQDYWHRNKKYLNVPQYA